MERVTAEGVVAVRGLDVEGEFGSTCIKRGIPMQVTRRWLPGVRVGERISIPDTGNKTAAVL